MNQLSMTYPQVYSQPSYSCNGVKIDIHNPQATGGFPQPTSPQAPMMPQQQGCYNYPQGSLYAQNPMAYPIPYLPQPARQVVSQLPQQVKLEKPVVVDDVATKIQPAPQQVATVAPPVPHVVEGPKQVVNNNVSAPVAAPKDTMKSVDKTVVANAVKANDKPQDTVKEQVKVEIKPSEDLSAKLRGDIVEKLTSPDEDVKSRVLIDIANTTQQLAEMKKAVDNQVLANPDTQESKALQQGYQKAFDSVAAVVLDEKVVEGILATLVKDTSSLQGPTPKQIELRGQELQGKSLSDEEKAEAHTLSPMEKAEQNKEFSLFTLRLIQEMYMEGISQMTGAQPDLKDVPGVEQMVVTVKSNPNPAIRAAAISAITHNPREQDKEMLSTILKIASEQDADPSVRQVAAKSMEKMNANTTTNKA